MFFPPSLDSSELRARIEAISAGEPLLPLVEDSLENPTKRLPGRGWVVVVAVEANGILTVLTLREGHLLDQIRPDLDAISGRTFWGASDLGPSLALSAARVDAVLHSEPLLDLTERYRVEPLAIAALVDSEIVEEGLPEVILGVTAWIQAAG